MSEAAYIQYYQRQAGSGVADIGPVYNRSRIKQRGRGIGNVFGAIYRFVKPLFASLVPALKSTAINASAGIINDIGNKPFKQVLKDNSKNAIKTFIDAAKQQQTGRGSKKKSTKHIKSKTNLNKVQSHIRHRKGNPSKKKSLKKALRVLDIFSR